MISSLLNGCARGAVVVVVALMGEALAQTTCPVKPTCDPMTVKDRRECGAELKGVTSTGQWRAWWHPIEKTTTTWRWCPFQWAMLDKYAPSPRGVITIVDAIKDAPDVPQAIMDALTQHSVQPQAGSQDEYEFRLLHYAACQALRANPPVSQWIGAGPAPCVSPTPPTPPAGWKAYGGAIYRHAAGKLTGVVSGKTAAKDAPCTGLTVSTAGTFVYQELVGGVAGEATRCVKP